MGRATTMLRIRRAKSSKFCTVHSDVGLGIQVAGHAGPAGPKKQKPISPYGDVLHRASRWPGLKGAGRDESTKGLVVKPTLPALPEGAHGSTDGMHPEGHTAFSRW